MAEKLVLAGPASRDLGRAIAERLGAPLLKSEFKVFPDGESKFSSDARVAGKNVIIVQSTYPPADMHLFQLLLASHHLSQEGAKITAVVPYLAYARQDKEFLPGEAVTLGVVAHLMRSVGVRRLVTVDIHSAVGLSLFSFPVYSVSAIPALVEYSRSELGLRDPVVVSPDLGGSTRTDAFAQLYGTALLQLSKTRDRVTGGVKLRDAKLEVRGKDVLIVDDIVSTGGTICAAAEAVRAQGARRVVAVCIHGLFVEDALRNLQDAGVETIVVTNTVPGEFCKVDVSEAIVSHLKTLDD